MNKYALPNPPTDWELTEENFDRVFEFNFEKIQSKLHLPGVLTFFQKDEPLVRRFYIKMVEKVKAATDRDVKYIHRTSVECAVDQVPIVGIQIDRADLVKAEEPCAE